MDTKYWANINGKQVGPLTRDELANMNWDSKSTYVWRNGMSNWTLISEVEELSDLVRYHDFKVACAPQSGEQSVPEIPATGNDAPASEPTTTATPPEIPMVEPQPVHNIFVAKPQPQPQPMATATQPQQGKPECPPTNLVWAVLSLILCCLPLSIVAIIYSTKVSRLYAAGDFVGAQKASDKAAGWTIASIVISLLASPFVYLFQVLTFMQ